MWELMVAASNAIESVVTIGWVWTVISIAVWIGVVFLALAGEPAHNREGGAVMGSLIGAVLGFITPVLLMLLPFILPLILAAAALATLGLVVAHFSKVGK